ncbi:MAG TPA: hypothetical protein VGK67_01440 [Myxococcales bacterium]|jgi:hypothetical protein
MRFLTDDEVTRQLEQWGVKFNEKGEEELGEYGARLRFRVPPEAGRRTALSRVMSLWFKQDGDVLLVIDEWGLYPACEDLNLFTRFRQSYGEGRNLREAPGHLIKADEREALRSLVALMLYFVWGGSLLSRTMGLLVQISHDDTIGVFAKDAARLEEIRSDLQSFKVVEVEAAK